MHISHRVETTTSTDAEIAKELKTDENIVKAIRQDLANQQQRQSTFPATLMKALNINA